MSAPSIVHLNRRLLRASEAGRGIDLTAADLDLLVSINVLPKVQEAANEYLREQVTCRVARHQSIGVGNTGSTSSAARTGPSVRIAGTSSGTTPERDARQARQRASG